MKIYKYLQKTIQEKGAAYLILLDPDKLSEEKLIPFVKHCEKSGVDGFLIGGSLMVNNNMDSFIEAWLKPLPRFLQLFSREVLTR
jgi:heptaprenylglyceryl phosphate synthase